MKTRLHDVTQAESLFLSRAVCGLLLGLFCLILLGTIGNPAAVHPDERFYTDSTIQMLQSGDYWTPYYPDGRIRLIKPILTYWSVAGGFQTFGISLFASRVAPVLAGVLAVGLTFQLGWAMTRDRRTALLAAAILAANVKLLVISTRATPDAFLCLFTLVSTLGFARIWFQQDESWIGPLLAFGGLGLAVQTKGLIGLWPLGAVGVFWLVDKPSRIPLRSLLHWPAIVLGIALAGFWYAEMLRRHGAGALQDFFQDQVGTRVTHNPLSVFGNLAAYSGTVLQHFLPWTLLVLVIGLRQRAAFGAFWRSHRGQILFATLPFVLLGVALSLGSVRAQRYLTSTFPVLAVAVALALTQLPIEERVWFWVRRLAGVAAALAILGGTILLLAGFTGCGRLIVGGLALAGVGIAGVRVCRSADPLGCWLWIPALVVTTFAIDRGCLQPLRSPQTLPPLARQLLQGNPPGSRVYTWQVRPSRAGLIRLLTEGKFIIREISTNGSGPIFSNAPIAVTIAPHQSLFKEAGFDVTPIEPDPNDCRVVRQFACRLFPSTGQIEPQDAFWVATKQP